MEGGTRKTQNGAGRPGGRIAGILTLGARLTIILHRDGADGAAAGQAGDGADSTRRRACRQRQPNSARRGGRLRGLHRLRVTGREAFAAVIGNRAIDDGTAVDALPCVEDQKEV